MNAMPWEDLCRIPLKESIVASPPWLAHRFTHNKIINFVFPYICEMTFQNTSCQKFVSLVTESLN